MIFFGAFAHGWEMERFHIFQVATVLGLWGVVISAVYMLRAYRRVFMGPIPEEWKGLTDLRVSLRVPITLLIAAMLWLGFFPQAFVQLVSPAFRSYFSAEQSR
jgi:NADH-quinone oxidoreductase subunit M